MADELIRLRQPEQEEPLERRDYTMRVLERAAMRGTISRARQEEIRLALHHAAAARAAAYTRGRSTTVTKSQAEAFYASLFCQLDTLLLSMPSDAAAEEALRSESIAKLLEAGQIRTIQLYEESKERFRAAYQLTEPFHTSFYRGLLEGFEKYCTQYDARFRAADIQVEYIYPLMLDQYVIESGVTGVHRYYSALLTEAELLQFFDRDALLLLMQNYAAKYPTPVDMIAENIAELAVRHWICRMLYGERDLGLRLTEEMVRAVQAEYALRSQEDLYADMVRAVQESAFYSKPEIAAYMERALQATAVIMYMRISGESLRNWLSVA